MHAAVINSQEWSRACVSKTLHVTKSSDKPWLRGSIRGKWEKRKNTEKWKFESRQCTSHEKELWISRTGFSVSVEYFAIGSSRIIGVESIEERRWHLNPCEICNFQLRHNHVVPALTRRCFCVWDMYKYILGHCILGHPVPLTSAICVGFFYPSPRGILW